VELRKDMWDVVYRLKASGVTIVLTTHYIEEAEAIADRVGVIANGAILLVEDKDKLMAQMGIKELYIDLQDAIKAIPPALASYNLRLAEDGRRLTFISDAEAEQTDISNLLTDLSAAGLALRDLQTSQSSLEDIFVDLVKD